MNKFWKKTGWVGMTILPCILSLILQLGMGVVLGVVLAIAAMLQQDWSKGFDMESYNTFVTEHMNSSMGALVFICHILIIIIFGLWYRYGCGKPKITNPLKHFGGRTLPVVVILSIGMCLFANAFVLVGQYVAPKAIEAYMELVEAAGLGENTLTILASILLAPIGEEFVCRGVTYHYAKKVVADMNNRRVAFWIANTLQAIMFGVMHGNLIQGLYAFALGLGLGWLRERYHSLYPAMLAHAIINFSSTFLVGYPISLLPENIISYVVLMFVSIGIIIAALLLGKSCPTVEGIAPNISHAC